MLRDVDVDDPASVPNGDPSTAEMAAPCIVGRVYMVSAPFVQFIHSYFFAKVASSSPDSE